MRTTPFILMVASLAALSARADAGDEDARATVLEASIANLFDKTHGINAADVARRTARVSPSLAASRADVDAAAARVHRALAAYIPSFQTQTSRARLSHVAAQPPFESPRDQTAVQATLIVPISDYVLRISGAHAAASKGEQAAILQAQATELSVMSDARLAYYEWARSLLQVIVTQQALAQANQHLSDAKSAFDAGTASRADVSRVEAQVAAAEQADIEARNLVRVLDERLRTLMREPAGAAYTLGEDLLNDPATASTFELAALVEEALQNRIEPRVVSHNVDALEATIRSIRAGYFPQLSAVGQVLYANPNSRYLPLHDEFDGSWSIGAQAIWTPSAIPDVAAQISEKAANIRSLASQRTSIEDGIRLEVAQAKQAIDNARSALKTRGRGLLAAEEAYRVRGELFRSGRATSVELTDTETELTRAGLEAIDAHIDLRVALVRFEHATGRDVVAIKITE
jgi:outer membrane protein TolC